MPTVRNIVKSFRVETAVGKRTCDVSEEHVIEPGDKHFAYEEVPGQRKNICMACAPAILKKAQNQLALVMKEVPSAKG
jgi:hypothetical protein